MMNTRTFAQQMRTVREETGQTYEMIADGIGVTPSFLSHIIRRGAKNHHIERIAAYLKVSPTYFDVYHMQEFEDKWRDRLAVNDPWTDTIIQLLVTYGSLTEPKKKRLMAKVQEVIDGT